MLNLQLIIAFALLVNAACGEVVDVCQSKRCYCESLPQGKFVVNCTKSDINDLSTVSFPYNTTSLILDGCPLKVIPAGIFNNLTVLGNLSMKALTARTKVAIDLLDDTFSGLGNLTQLVFTGTRLKNVGMAAFSGLKSLEHLDLGSTMLASFPNLDNSTELSVLILSNNLLVDIALGKCCAKLSRLVLAHNAIAALSDATFQSVPLLTTLSLNENLINNVTSAAFAPLKQLDSIELSSNPITTAVLTNITSSLASTIKSIKLSNTGISGLPDSALGKFSKLSTLDLSHTLIGNLTAKTFEQLATLVDLNLHNASISQVGAAAFAKLTALRYLKLGANKITSLPRGAFESLSSLEDLDLSSQVGMLSDIPLNGFSNLKALRKLNLSSNKLGALIANDSSGVLLGSLVSLVDLNLDNNRISTLQLPFFGNVSQLKIANLYLQDNLIATWPAQLFKTLTSLRQLNLSSNGIELITSDTVGGFPNATFELLLAGNSWACNCSLLWFRNWLNSTALSPNVSVPNWQEFVCGPLSASTLKNVPLVNFDNSSIACGPPPTPPPFVQSNSFLYGVILFAIVATLLVTFVGLALYRYDVAIRLHLMKLRNAAANSSLARPSQASGSRESLLRGGDAGFGPVDRSFTHDVYVIYADNHTDRGWVQGALRNRLNTESYMLRECYPRDLSCTFGWFERLARIDECVNVLIVVSDRLESRQHPGLLQLDIRYVFDRAELLPERFKPPIVVQRGAFCSCGMRQRLPRRLVAQVHCETCRLTDSNSAQRAARAGSIAALRWPESQIEEDAEEFFSSLKVALGLPLVVADVDLNNMHSRSTGGTLAVQISPNAGAGSAAVEDI